MLAGDRLLEAARRSARPAAASGSAASARGLDDALPIPADLIYAEYARVGATAALVARAFPDHRRTSASRSAAPGPGSASWRTAGPEALAAAHAELARRAAALTTW